MLLLARAPATSERSPTSRAREDAALARGAGRRRRRSRQSRVWRRSASVSSSRMRRATPILRRPLTHDALGRERLVTAPPLTRTSMVPRAWPPGCWRVGSCAVRRAGRCARRRECRTRPRRRPTQRPTQASRSWRRAATFRRLVLLGLIVSQTYIATNFMIAVLPYHGRQPLEIADPRPVRDPVRLGVGGILDGDRRLRAAADRQRSLRDLATRAPAMRRSIPTHESRS